MSRSWRATLTRHLTINVDADAVYESMMQSNRRRDGRFDVQLLGSRVKAKIKYADARIRGLACDMKLIHSYFLSNDPILRLFQDEFIRTVKNWKNKDIRTWQLQQASLDKINEQILLYEIDQPDHYKRMGELTMNDAKLVVRGPVEHETYTCERMILNDIQFCVHTKDVNRKTTNSYIEHMVSPEDKQQRIRRTKNSNKERNKAKARRKRQERGVADEGEEEEEEENVWDVAHIRRIYICQPYSHSHRSNMESTVLLRVIDYEVVENDYTTGVETVRALADDGKLVPITAIKCTENIALWPVISGEHGTFIVVRLTSE